ncbi:MAG: hypothetical protein IJB19_02755 [Clostridia bacterium]|nr:hypothetical protein [Clostridia bacterium]
MQKDTQAVSCVSFLHDMGENSTIIGVFCEKSCIAARLHGYNGNKDDATEGKEGSYAEKK